ncbi:MAG: hypothetical protein NVSMB55_09080 [Mycobacteriales bacterium]
MDSMTSIGGAECLQLLGSAKVGRVAFTERALPAIQRLAYSLVGSSLVLTTESPGLARRLDGQVVAFAVDCVDAELGTGWSVMVTGRAQLMDAPDGPGLCLQLLPGQMSGRRS